jgi:hypothetical protein
VGYAFWLPPDLTTRTSAVAELRIDTWAAPSHTQAARVADGRMDLAVCWVAGVLPGTGGAGLATEQLARDTGGPCGPDLRWRHHRPGLL